MNPNFSSSYLASVEAAKQNGTALTPSHTFTTNYRYNSLNQVIAQLTPDVGLSHYWYDRLGRLAVSQNAKQAIYNQYSYTVYDSIGRITEVGQNTTSTAMSQAISQNDGSLISWIYGGTGDQITQTVYDIPYSPLYGQYISQQNLRNRVSYTVLYNQAADTSYLNRNPASASYYTYDIHGNVDTLLQDYNGIASMKNSNNRFKLIAYNYDLISGKVNEVDYQPGRSDAFYEMYSYDAENRITTVSYSRDNVYQEREAAYEYYKHGPLARTVLGKLDVQGLKYRYTLQGWLKGVNAAIAGVDATAADSSEVFPVSHDAYGFSLHYYPGDYTAIKSSTPYTGLLPALGSSGAPLFNGNIAAMAVNIKAIGSNAAPLVYNYHYDQLNRLVSMDAYSGLNTTTGSFTPIQLSTYAERAGYDPNGNITSYIRHGDAARVQMDSLTYSYKAGKNQLDNVVDNAADVASNLYSNYNDLKSGQQPGNYQYDAIGNLTSDAQAGISNIIWTVYGKIDSIYKADGTGIKYHYDVAGNRISKVVTKGSTVNGTYYVRDAQGNVMSVYQDGSSMALTQMENHLYGSSRLGMVTALTVANTNVTLSSGNTGIVSTFTRGEKLFELSNHLGNVLVTLTDKKLQHSSDNINVDYYVADVASASDYYPFGMQMPSRIITASTLYRYGFNGKELDPNIDGNNYDYGFRIYNPQIGKFLSVDPLMKSFAWYSPYHFAGNSPIAKLDLDGREPQDFKEKWKYQPLFDLKTNDKVKGTGTEIHVTDAKLGGGQLDVQMVYDQVTKTNWFIHQDGNKSYYLKNDDGNNSVMTIDTKTYQVKGGHFAEFETQNQAQARLTNELVNKAEAGIFIGAATAAALPALGAASATGTFAGKGVASAGYDVMAQLGTNKLNVSKINISEVGLSFFLQDGGLTSKGIVKSFAKNAGGNLLEYNFSDGYKGIGSNKFSYSEAAIKTGIGTGFDIGVNLFKKIPTGKELTNRLLESQSGQFATGTAGAAATNTVGEEKDKVKN